MGKLRYRVRYFFWGWWNLKYGGDYNYNIPKNTLTGWFAGYISYTNKMFHLKCTSLFTIFLMFSYSWKSVVFRWRFLPHFLTPHNISAPSPPSLPVFFATRLYRPARHTCLRGLHSPSSLQDWLTLPTRTFLSEPMKALFFLKLHRFLWPACWHSLVLTFLSAESHLNPFNKKKVSAWWSGYKQFRLQWTVLNTLPS